MQALFKAISRYKIFLKRTMREKLQLTKYMLHFRKVTLSRQLKLTKDHMSMVNLCFLQTNKGVYKDSYAPN